MSLKTLEQACQPRASVFDPSVRDTVWNIDDLHGINANDFFAENYVTQGMQQLLTETFRRLEGKSQNTSGAFLLSQSMGGGKTHNLIALGLLAKHPALREQVMAGFYQPGPLGAVRVVTFSGRKTHTQFGVWGEIAEQLNKKDAFRDFYSPLKPPGDGDWIEMLRGEPVLILLDELPPYFSAARGFPVGSTTLDVITTTALANLLVAVTSDKLPNACVVMTDLSARAYAAGSEAIESIVGESPKRQKEDETPESLQDLAQEANRSVTRIEPVRLASDELYHIMRTRLFDSIAEQEDIAAVADAYRLALNEAATMGLTSRSPDNLRKEIVASYPFHPGIQDLFARFRENPGFQQTRALIRIMRHVVAGLWNSGEARHKHLIGAQDLDLHEQDVMSEIRMINASLESAIAHDIAKESGTTVAEAIDGPGRSDAQDAAKLIFLSSLSQAVTATNGLDRSTIVGYLAAPGRDITTLRSALDDLQAQAWYLHSTGTGLLYFRNTQNLNAKLESYAQGILPGEREAELAKRLEEMFAPQTRAIYADVEALPALDKVSLNPDRVTLVIFQPRGETKQEIERFFEQQQYKNRVLFLTGDPKRYGQVLNRAAYLRAIDAIIVEFQRERMREDEPQFKDAREIQTRERSQFYMACREVFQTLYYPSARGLIPFEIDPKYAGNEFKGEAQITETLKSIHKYTDDTSADSGFPARVLDRLWPQASKEVKWSEIKRLAAASPGWVWHHPRALDDLRDEMVRRGTWRAHDGDYVERGPFEAPDPEVSITRLRRSSDTGEVALRVRPLHADTIYWSQNGPATEASDRLDAANDLVTAALSLSFLAVDSGRPEKTGKPYVWRNEIDVKYRQFDGDGGRLCELRAIPSGEIRYTIDGSSPETSGIPYTEPFPLPKGKVVLQALARADGITSQRLQVEIKPDDGPDGVEIDPNTSAVWLKKHKRDSTGETYDFLRLVEQRAGKLSGVRLEASASSGRWVELMTDPEATLLEAAAVRTQIEALQALVPGGNVTLDVSRLSFASGRDLQDIVADLKATVGAGEVRQ